jgi:hypothetical protein
MCLGDGSREGEPGEHRELAVFHQLRRVRKLDYTA